MDASYSHTKQAKKRGGWNQVDKATVVDGVAMCVEWWIERRMEKLREALSDSMAVNPFLIPILFDMHGIDDFGELSDFLVGSHLMNGHNTGFGKLMDEKILPRVFGTQKLDKAYRGQQAPFADANFNEIDHVVTRADGSKYLLSLKSGRWTIQLTMATQLNAAFNRILQTYGSLFDGVVVGVIYGTADSLTDKYDILRGINRGAKHNVLDLTENVSVYAGRAFWSWLNEDIPETQDWILEGIQAGIVRGDPRQEARTLLSAYNAAVARNFDKFIGADGRVDWAALLTEING